MKANKIFLIVCTLFILQFITAKRSVASSDEFCELVGEISIEAIQKGAALKCLTTGDLVACEIAYALNDTATNYIAKKGVTAGCNWTVQISKKMLKLTVKSVKKKKVEFEKIYNALNTIEGINWLQKKLQ